jgi:LysM repeat protein
MKPKPKPLQSSSREFDSNKFWRHYVATVDTEEEWTQDRPQPGRGSNRLFLFLLLFHVFLIGSVVLFNLVAERPKPVFLDNSVGGKVVTSSPSKNGSAGPQALAVPATPASKQGETVEHRVEQGDSLKSIADASGVSQEEIAKMNQIEVSTQLAVGSVLRVPKPKTKPPVIPVGVQPARVDEKVLVQATTSKAGSTIFKAVEPTPAPTPAPKKVETPSAPKPETSVASKPPEDKPKTKAADNPPSAVKSKATEAKAIARPEPPPTPPASKNTEVAKTPPPSPPKAPETAASKSLPRETPKTVASSASHTVKPKETFYSISRKYSVKVEDLMRVNGFTDPGKLREGLVLKLPK